MNKVFVLSIFLLVSSMGLSAVELDIPYYEQGHSAPWTEVIMGNKSKLTIGQSGCALTCVSMIVSGFEGDRWTPEGMNDWLKSHGGFHDGWDDGDGSYLGEVNLNWPALASFGKGYVYTRHDWAVMPADLVLIRYYLDRKVPVIAEVFLRGAPHYVVLTGYEGNVFFMNDPEFPDEHRFGEIYKLADKWGSGPSRNIYGIRVLYPVNKL